MKTNYSLFGTTTSGLPITAYHFGPAYSQQNDLNDIANGAPHVLILGGVHGDEIEGINCALGLLKVLTAKFDYKLNLTLVPIFNLDGALIRERRNSNLVDLNRNLPTRDWTNDIPEVRYYPGTSAGSESENQALIHYLNHKKPKFILSLHSWHPLLNINGNCRAQAEAIQKHTGYKIEESIGYPTPGCLGTYAGLELNMPTLTYEIERGLDRASIIDLHVTAILDALKICENL
jgi:protein MpaA